MPQVPALGFSVNVGNFHNRGAAVSSLFKNLLLVTLLPVVDPFLDVFFAITDSARTQADGRWKLSVLSKPPSGRPAQDAASIEIPFRQKTQLI